MDRILVTGSEGFLGTHLCTALAQDDVELWTLDVEGSGEKHLSTSVQEFTKFEEFDTIYHLAAISNPRTCQKEKEKAWTVNVEGTRNIVKQLSSDQRLVFSSSAHVYDQEQNTLHDEEERLDPNNFYGVTKQTAEQLIRHHSQGQGFNYTVFRIFNVYGPGQSRGYIVPDVIHRAQENDELEVRDGTSRISPVYVEDAIDVITQKISNGTYNVCHDCVRVNDIYQHIGDMMDVSIKSSDNPEENTHLCGNDDRIRKYKTNWTGLKKGLRKTIEETIGV